MYNNSFLKQVLFLASVVLLASCDKDYNVIGEDLIGENHFNFESKDYSVLAYNQKTGAVQSNNLPVNALGIYDDPAFGKTTANFATQLVLETPDPEIGANAVIDSVYLYVPYFSKKTATATDGAGTYKLDSIYGSSDANKRKIKLSVYESGYFMRDLDPLSGFQESQKYFTDQNAVFDAAKVGSRLNNSVNVAQNDAFFFDSAEHVEKVKDDEEKVTTTRLGPGMRLKLNENFFKTKILEAPAGKLASNDVFKEYFRGLYFKVEDVEGSTGNLAMLNFGAGKITIKYKEDLVKKDANGNVISTTRVVKSIVLNLTGNKVSLLKNEIGTSGSVYGALPNTGNITDGDDKLYLKGGDGSMAVIELFKTPGELEAIRNSGWLINEASLTFHIDRGAMDYQLTPESERASEPNRIYLYDLTNNVAIADYFAEDPKGKRPIFDGVIKKEAVTGGRGLTYRIRITNHIRNLVKKDSKAVNVKLGVVVTEDISASDFYKLKVANDYSSLIPRASVMNPLGTVLYGSRSTVSADKRLKLQIFYTKPN